MYYFLNYKNIHIRRQTEYLKSNFSEIDVTYSGRGGLTKSNSY